MTSFRDYYDLADPLVLPIRSKDYEIPPASSSDVIRYRRMLDLLEKGEPLTPSVLVVDEDYHRMFLGAALDEMRADGVHPGVIEHAAHTAMTDTLANREAAERVWNSIDPKASSPVTVPVFEKDSTPSTSTDAATTTS